MQNKYLPVEIPFSGFYGTDHDAMFDGWLDYEQEVLQSDHDATLEQLQYLSERFYQHVNWEAVRLDYAKEYTSVLETLIADNSTIKPKLEFIEMTSPREYNFDTDRIYANISIKDLKAMLKAVPSKAWREFVKD